MPRKYRILLIPCLLLLTLIGFSSRIFAKEEPNFSIDAVLPANQRKESQATYFDLVVKPETTQNIQLAVTNLGAEPLELQLNVIAATTNSLGVIEYSKARNERDDTAKYILTELLKMPTSVNLKGKERKIVTGELRMPKAPFPGIILGSITAEPLMAESKAESGVTITSASSLIIGVVLTEDPATKVEPELTLESVEPGLANGFISVLAELHNIQPQLVGNLKITGRVTSKTDGNFKKETTRNYQEMAPNSRYQFPVGWDGEEIQAGDYHLHLIAQNSQHRWVFDQDFKVTAKSQEQINQIAVGVKKSYCWLWLLLFILLIILIAIGYYFYQKKKQAKTE